MTDVVGGGGELTEICMRSIARRCLNVPKAALVLQLRGPAAVGLHGLEGTSRITRSQPLCCRESCQPRPATGAAIGQLSPPGTAQSSQPQPFSWKQVWPSPGLGGTGGICLRFPECKKHLAPTFQLSLICSALLCSERHPRARWWLGMGWGWDGDGFGLSLGQVWAGLGLGWG